MSFVGKSFFVQSGRECGKQFRSTTSRGKEKYIKVITIEKKCDLSMPLTALGQVLELNTYNYQFYITI